MNNIQKPHILVYAGLILILVVLVVLVSIISLPQSKKPNISPSPKLIPTDSNTSPSRSVNRLRPTPTISYPTPTGTGASEEIPKNIEDAAIQKQNLKKILPLQQTYFTINFDYSTDKFIVTLFDPKNASKQNFFVWLKNNYPLISTSKFIFE